MSGDALATLLRIRQASLDEAHRALAEALHRQGLAQQASQAEQSRYTNEAAAALDLAAGDEAVDAFARWLPIGRRAAEAARLAEQEASGEVDRVRIVLGLTRAACRAVEALIELRGEEARQAEDRKAQQAMDDLAGRRRLP